MDTSNNHVNPQLFRSIVSPMMLFFRSAESFAKLRKKVEEKYKVGKMIPCENQYYDAIQDKYKVVFTGKEKNAVGLGNGGMGDVQRFLALLQYHESERRSEIDLLDTKPDVPLDPQIPRRIASQIMDFLYKIVYEKNDQSDTRSYATAS